MQTLKLIYSITLVVVIAILLIAIIAVVSFGITFGARSGWRLSDRYIQNDKQVIEHVENHSDQQRSISI